MTSVVVSYEAESVPTTGSAGFSCPAAAKHAVVLAAVCANTSVSDSTLVCHVVASGGTVVATNQYVQPLPMPAKTDKSVDTLISLSLDPGDTIVPLATDANRLSFKLSMKVVY